MAISTEAGKALGLISGIDVCHKPEPGYWRDFAVRIVMDLDLVGPARKALPVITDVLREQWGLFGADRARAKPLAEIGDPVVIDRADLEALYMQDAIAPDVGKRVRALLGRDC